MTSNSSMRCIIHADLDAFYASVEQMTVQSCGANR